MLSQLTTQSMAPITTPATKTVIPLPSVEPVEITNLKDIFSANDSDFDLTKFKSYKLPNNVWHQVIIHHNGIVPQKQVLGAIFEAIGTNEMIPCYYKVGKKYDSFLVRESFDALDCLYIKKLALTTNNGPLTLTLKMRVAEVKEAHLDPLKTMFIHVATRYDYVSKTLDLQRFAESEALENIVCPLSVPRIFTNILTHVSRKYASNVEKLILSHNELRSTRGMHPIIWLKSLREIDFRNNKIEELKHIESMPKGTIQTLWLGGNPLCLKYSGGSDYVKAVKEILPNLEQLVSNKTSF